MRTQTPQWANHVVFCNTNGTNILGGDLAQWAHNNYKKKTNLSFMHTQTPQWANQNVFCIRKRKQIRRGET